MTPLAKAQLVKALGRDVGFDLVGVTHARPIGRTGYYRQWLAKGYGGTMGYLRRHVPYREDPARLLSGARAVICAAINYKRTDGYARPGAAGNLPVAGQVAGGGGEAGGSGSGNGPTGLVAGYARGRDYHVVLRAMLHELVARLRTQIGEQFDARVFVDTGPLLERELAVAAGLGWFGRNTCLLNAELGSYLFLGEVITTLDMAADQPVAERCGSCRRCIDACPTGALVAPREMDARRCISYLTIEHRGPIADELQPLMADRLFGCDICQQVCPYNAKAPLAAHPAITADVLAERVDLIPVLSLRSGGYRRLTAGSAATRARRNMWRRNAAVALGNAAAGAAAEDVRAALEQPAQDTDEGVRHAAALSLARLPQSDGGTGE